MVTFMSDPAEEKLDNKNERGHNLMSVTHKVSDLQPCHE
jgi:hypothetical protein